MSIKIISWTLVVQPPTTEGPWLRTEPGDLGTQPQGPKPKLLVLMFEIFVSGP